RCDGWLKNRMPGMVMLTIPPSPFKSNACDVRGMFPRLFPVFGAFVMHAENRSAAFCLAAWWSLCRSMHRCKFRMLKSAVTKLN
ncbi:hypothetical protein ACPPTR_13430, partial [Ralstonia pseudosolanacearum]